MGWPAGVAAQLRLIIANLFVYIQCPPPSRQDVPIEYGGEEQAIVAVGLARPRPGVFVEAIQHLLVLCTTTEVGRGCYAPCDWLYLVVSGPKAAAMGVFVEAIQHLLVLCTTTEVGGGLFVRCMSVWGDHHGMRCSGVLLLHPPRCTTLALCLQIVLLGVCCSPGPGGSGDACEELTLQPLPLYRWATCFADAP